MLKLKTFETVSLYTRDSGQARLAKALAKRARMTGGIVCEREQKKIEYIANLSTSEESGVSLE